MFFWVLSPSVQNNICLLEFGIGALETQGNGNWGQCEHSTSNVTGHKHGSDQGILGK